MMKQGMVGKNEENLLGPYGNMVDELIEVKEIQFYKKHGHTKLF